MNDIDMAIVRNASNGSGKPNFSRIRSIEDAEVKGKRVLLRVDFNVPMQDGAVTDATRIERVIPTIRMLADRGAKIVILTHFGRPKGKASAENSIAPVAAKLAELMPGTKVHFVKDCIGPEAEKAVTALKAGEVAVLENLRFHVGEEKNDSAFAKQLASLGDLYADDAFSASHRAHASVDAITKLVPAYAGLLMIAEIRALDKALEHPQRPVIAIAGGSKVSTKIAVLTNLTERMDALVLGGGMASTFLFAQGVEIGKSLCQPEAVPIVEEIVASAKRNGCEIILPHDFVVAKELKAGTPWRVAKVGDIGADEMIVDIGPDTVAALAKRFETVKTLLWNGPVGAFEFDPFGRGTFDLMRAAGKLAKDGKLMAIAGGGDTVAALNLAGVGDDFTYVSTAGGAFLEWLEGKTLPGVAALAAA